jgi:TPP-dependent pyruvate/acetoin dehydrogenase alpha subunit/pyruvate/2-oxoglutarate/acetoin dehydrogenase E1 component
LSPTSTQPTGATVFPSRETLEMLLLIRHFEETLLALFQAGKLNGTTHTCLGQEAIPATVMPLLRDDDFVFSNHRGHGHYLARFNDPEGLMAEIMGREGAVCGGVGGSQHIKLGRYLSTGIQGESLPVAVGAALELKREGRGGIAVPFIGDGTWGQGAVYEALNMAALWRVPLCVIVENNGIAQTTGRELNMAEQIAGRVRAFGVDFLHCPERDVDELRPKVAAAIQRVREGAGPLVIEFETHRLGAHSKSDDTRHPDVVADMRAAGWYERYRAARPEEFAGVEAQVKNRIAALAEELEKRPPTKWNAPAFHDIAPLSAQPAPEGGERVLDNLNRALHAVMEDERVFLLGEDILDPYGGAFKVSRGVSSKYAGRVLTTPISELGFAGVGNGLALAGQRPVVEFMFGDFIFLAFDQIVNFAAKSVTMYGGREPHHILFRCPVGGHRGYGATHSQSVQKHFIGVPDLDLFEISPLHDNTALLPWILERGNPAVLFEGKTLYAQPQFSGGVIDDLFTFDFLDNGLTARAFIEERADAVIVTSGGMFSACLAAARELFLEHEIEVQVVVPFQLYPFRTLPLEKLTRELPVFVVEEGPAGGTWGAEVAAALARTTKLHQPVALIHSAPSIIPSARHLEKEVLVQPADIVQRISGALA